ncbi:MAG: hypothetical protein AB7O60_05240 [Variibacter sp.]
MWQTNSNLDGLVDLSRRQGVDVRPSLLRVLTDLYVQQPQRHTDEEERQYVELAGRLLPVVDKATRVTVATKLAGYAFAPAAVIAQLSRDIAEIASLVQHKSTTMPIDAKPTTEELITAIFGPDASPSRAQASSTASQQTKAPAPEAKLEANAEKAIEPAAESALSTSPADPEQDSAPEQSLGARFLAAHSDARLEMLLNMEDEHVPTNAPPRPASADTISRLETAAFAQKQQEFAHELQQALSLLPSVAMQITQDATGETLLVAARALGMPAAVLQRILIFLNPAIGHSVQRVFALANFYERVSRNAAARLVESWRRDAAPARKARYVGVHAPEAAERTSTLMDHARRGIARTSDTAGQRGETAATTERRQRTT